MTTQQQVTLVLKNPSTHGTDFTLQMSLTSSIADVKRKVSEDHPEKPGFEKQRLIFSGKLLGDHEKLSDVLQPDRTDLSQPQKFHLVIRRDTDNRTNLQNSNPTGQPQPPIPGQPPQWGGYQGPFGGQFQQHPYYHPPPPTYDFMHQQPPPGGAYNNNGGQQPPLPPQWGGYPGNFPYPPHQPFYPQGFQGGVGMGVGLGMGMPYQPVQVQRLGFARINLDLGLMLKLLLLVWVLSQGGGSQRMAFLIALAIAYYLYHTGIARLQYVQFGENRQQQPQQQPQQQQQQPQQQPLQQQQPQARANQQENVEDNNRADQAPEGHQQPGGVIGEIFGFFVPLLCSILPSWQPPENVHVRPQPQPQQAQGNVE